MTFNHRIVPGQILENHEIVSIFKCAPRGGMRRSLRTNSLVIVSDHTESLYEDRWEDDVFHYTGMGRTGDQKLDSGQNKTLAESRANGVDIYLFEVFREKEYVFIGQVELAGQPYQEEQLDIENNLRLVWVFPLRLRGNTKPFELPQEWIETKNKSREKKAKKLSDGELKVRARHTSKKAVKRATSKISYERNPYVSEYAKRWANGICQLCGEEAPFRDKNGTPYLESHHIEWLARGGDDTIENTIALCPNCHKKMHILDRKSDVEKLKNRVREHLLSLM